jgi:hypothetical protein
MHHIQFANALASEEGGGGIVPMIVGLAFAVFFYGGLWKMFSKAGQPGWAAIIPIYNAIVMLKIAGKPAWWLVLFLIPLVGAIVGLIMLYSLVQAFGKGAGYFVGCLFLGFIFIPLLGYGSAQYQGAPR